MESIKQPIPRITLRGAAIVAGATWFAAALAGSPMYRWVDANGVVQYSDQPHAGAAHIEVEAPNGARAPAPMEEQRFEDRGGTVADRETHLEWAKTDNGGDINWIVAMSMCNGRGAHWRLPTRDELSGLFDPSGHLSTACGNRVCKVSSKFRLSEIYFWTNEQAGASSVWDVGLQGNHTHSHPLSYAREHRALCVRRG